MNTTACLVCTCLLYVYVHTYLLIHINMLSLIRSLVWQCQHLERKQTIIPRCTPPMLKEINWWSRCCEVSFCTNWIVICKLHLNTLYSFSYKEAATTNHHWKLTLPISLLKKRGLYTSKWSVCEWQRKLVPGHVWVHYGLSFKLAIQCTAARCSVEQISFCWVIGSFYYTFILVHSCGTHRICRKTSG